MYFFIQVQTENGEVQPAEVLVNTGAQANLIRRNLFSKKDFAPARFPVNLKGVNGVPVRGGDMEITLQLFFNTASEKFSPLSATFYNADDIGVDMILSYPWLRRNGIIFDL